MMEITNESPWPVIDQIKNELKIQNNEIVEDLINFEPITLKDSNKIHAKITSDIRSCKLYVNESIIPYSDFDGIIFPPAVLKVVAPSGYRFLGWKNGGTGFVTLDPVVQIPDTDFSWHACFEMMSEDEKSIAGIHPIMINEVSPANDSFINDYFKKEDWVELYNTTSKPIDLNGMFLSDNADNLGKYRISSDGSASTIIQPGGYVLIWCDKREPISMLHAPFKLDADGGAVYLTSADGTYTDSLSYSSIRRNETVGRFPDGSVNGVYRMNVSTIGKANIYTSYSIIENSNSTTSTGKRINAENGIDLKFDGQSLVVKTKDEDVEIKIYSVDGTMIMRKNINVNGIEDVDLNFLPKGCFIGKAVCKDRRNAICKFIIM